MNQFIIFGQIINLIDIVIIFLTLTLGFLLCKSIFNQIESDIMKEKSEINLKNLQIQHLLEQIKDSNKKKIDLLLKLDIKKEELNNFQHKNEIELIKYTRENEEKLKNQLLEIKKNIKFNGFNEEIKKEIKEYLLRSIYVDI